MTAARASLRPFSRAASRWAWIWLRLSTAAWHRSCSCRACSWACWAVSPAKSGSGSGRASSRAWAWARASRAWAYRRLSSLRASRWWRSSSPASSASSRSSRSRACRAWSRRPLARSMAWRAAWTWASSRSSWGMRPAERLRQSFSVRWVAEKEASSCPAVARAATRRSSSGAEVRGPAFWARRAQRANTSRPAPTRVWPALAAVRPGTGSPEAVYTALKR